MQKSAGELTRDARAEASLDRDGVLALAHAMRTPLTAIALGLGLLEERAVGPLNDAQDQVVRALRNELARLALVVDRGLDTERLGAHSGPVERVRVSLPDIVRHAVAPIAPQAAAKGVTFTLDIDESGAVIADPIKLTWVVASLLGNALRYSRPGNTILVRGERDDSATSLHVADEGPGLPPEVGNAVFERDGQRGLTLFLVREIVEAHGGAIRVESVYGRGTTFIISLPNPPSSAGNAR